MWYNIAWMVVGIGLTIAVEAAIAVWLLNNDLMPGDN